MPPAALLREPVQGALVEEGVPVCSAVLLLTEGVNALVAIPLEAGEPAGLTVLPGCVFSVLAPTGEPLEVAVGQVRIGAFSDLDGDLDEAATRFGGPAGVAGDLWPEPARLHEGLPAHALEVFGAGGAVVAAPAPRGRGRAAAGRRPLSCTIGTSCSGIGPS